ncbi:MAG: hypothetical protein Q9165_001646 [Trypethelium subeluteriae]
MYHRLKYRKICQAGQSLDDLGAGAATFEDLGRDEVVTADCAGALGCGEDDFEVDGADAGDCSDEDGVALVEGSSNGDEDSDADTECEAGSIDVGANVDLSSADEDNKVEEGVTDDDLLILEAEEEDDDDESCATDE